MTIDGNGSSAGANSDGSGWEYDQEKQDQDLQDNDRWRELCRMVADEKNPARMSALLDELIGVLDKRRQKFRQDGPSDDAIDGNVELTSEAGES